MWIVFSQPGVRKFQLRIRRINNVSVKLLRDDLLFVVAGFCSFVPWFPFSFLRARYFESRILSSCCYTICGNSILLSLYRLLLLFLSFCYLCYTGFSDLFENSVIFLPLSIFLPVTRSYEHALLDCMVNCPAWQLALQNCSLKTRCSECQDWCLKRESVNLKLCRSDKETESALRGSVRENKASDISNSACFSKLSLTKRVSESPYLSRAGGLFSDPNCEAFV